MANENGVETLVAIAYSPDVAIIIRNSLRAVLGIGKGVPLDIRDVFNIEEKIKQGESQAAELNRKSSNNTVRIVTDMHLSPHRCNLH